MKPIENIFGFDCGTCEYNRHCYGGNIGNQFRYCQKSIEKVQNLDKLQQENKQLIYNWSKLKKYIKTEIPEDVFIDTKWFVSILDKMQELEKGSDNNVKD